MLEVIPLDILVPIDVAIDSENRYIVIGESIIRIYKGNNLVKQFLPRYFPGKTRLPSLTACAFEIENQEIYILDKSNLSIQIFDINGVFVRNKELFDTLTSPSKMKIINKYELIITDHFEHVLKRYNFYKLTCQSIGKYGISFGEFATPTGIDLDSDGNYLVADTSNHRVQVLQKTSEYLTVFGRLGDAINCFYNPVDIVYHPMGLVAVADKTNHRIVLYF